MENTIALSNQLKAECGLFPLGVLMGERDVGVGNVEKSKGRMHTYT